MVKRLLCGCLVLSMILCLTACSNENSEEETESAKTEEVEIKEERPFTESNGLIKYFIIENEKICLPETVGEYVKYLEKIGYKVELGDTGKSVEDAPELNAGGVSSMVAFLKVYINDLEDDWQWFGIRYENDTKKDLPISECKVTQISLDYDTIHEEENHHGIDSIVFITNDDQEIEMNGKTTSTNLKKIIGLPSQNTDGHWHYSDEQGYKYEMVTENAKGILTKVVITYPKG